jgi:hypothetical protein
MNDLGVSALKKVQRRLITFLALLYFAAFIDRVNVGFAALQMNRDLGFSAYVYGLGADPSLVLGFATLKYLPDSPADAKWIRAC